jgi:hypothetical protein
MPALELIVLVWPVAVAAGWMALRRRGQPAVMAPVLFAAMSASGVAIIPAAEHSSVPTVSAVVIAHALALAGLTDFMCGVDDPDDDGGPGGGGGRRPPPPDPPGGDGPREPDWWPEFERAFRAHTADHTRPVGR